MEYQKITRENLREHLRFSGWKYLLAAAVVFAVCNATISIVGNKVDPKEKIAISFVGYVNPTSEMNALQKELQEALPELKETKIYTLNLVMPDTPVGAPLPNGSLDVDRILKQSANNMLLYTFGEGFDYADVFILHQDLYDYFEQLDRIKPLDAAFESGILPEKLKAYAQYGYDEQGNQHIYGLDAAVLRRIQRTGIMFTQYNVACIRSTTQNGDAALKALAFLYESCVE